MVLRTGDRITLDETDIDVHTVVLGASEDVFGADTYWVTPPDVGDQLVIRATSNWRVVSRSTPKVGETFTTTLGTLRTVTRVDEGGLIHYTWILVGGGPRCGPTCLSAGDFFLDWNEEKTSFVGEVEEKPRQEEEKMKEQLFRVGDVVEYTPGGEPLTITDVGQHEYKTDGGVSISVDSFSANYVYTLLSRAAPEVGEVFPSDMGDRKVVSVNLDDEIVNYVWSSSEFSATFDDFFRLWPQEKPTYIRETQQAYRVGDSIAWNPGKLFADDGVERIITDLDAPFIVYSKGVDLEIAAKKVLENQMHLVSPGDPVKGERFQNRDYSTLTVYACNHNKDKYAVYDDKEGVWRVMSKQEILGEWDKTETKMTGIPDRHVFDDDMNYIRSDTSWVKISDTEYKAYHSNLIHMTIKHGEWAIKIDDATLALPEGAKWPTTLNQLSLLKSKHSVLFDDGVAYFKDLPTIHDGWTSARDHETGLSIASLGPNPPFKLAVDGVDIPNLLDRKQLSDLITRLQGESMEQKPPEFSGMEWEQEGPGLWSSSDNNGSPYYLWAQLTDEGAWEYIFTEYFDIGSRRVVYDMSQDNMDNWVEENKMPEPDRIETGDVVLEDPSWESSPHLNRSYLGMSYEKILGQNLYPEAPYDWDQSELKKDYWIWEGVLLHKGTGDLETYLNTVEIHQDMDFDLTLKDRVAKLMTLKEGKRLIEELDRLANTIKMSNPFLKSTADWIPQYLAEADDDNKTKGKQMNDSVADYLKALKEQTINNGMKVVTNKGSNAAMDVAIEYLEETAPEIAIFLHTNLGREGVKMLIAIGAGMALSHYGDSIPRSEMLIRLTQCQVDVSQYKGMEEGLDVVMAVGAKYLKSAKTKLLPKLVQIADDTANKLEAMEEGTVLDIVAALAEDEEVAETAAVLAKS